MKKFFLEGGSPTLSVVEIAITKYRNCPNINRAIEKIEKTRLSYIRLQLHFVRGNSKRR